MTILEFPHPEKDRGIPRIRMERGNLFADIIPDRRSGPDIYYVIVQERGSSEVLSLDRHESLQAAENSAEYVLRALAEKAA